MDQSESMKTNINTDETSNSLPKTTEYAYFLNIENVTKKIDFVFRIEVMGEKKFTRVKIIIIVSALIILLVGIPVSIVLTKKSDTKATKMLAKTVTTPNMETSTTGSCKR
ncbi:unnamed protein product [Adineta steineri]|uniref:Uncharacterized protein n=1 Tax=Adineta steineri TaxID=433720 RepID=A0A815JRG4_9BILA|nr:unnamed protein product [Adineta steineri]